jgi:cell wall-associated NlpC family hydrolase
VNIVFKKWILLGVFLLGICFGNADAEAAMLRLGDSGSEVVHLQETLQNLNYDVGNVDGDFGEWTWQAVVDFQADHGLLEDGIVGSQTWEAFRNAAPRVSRDSSSHSIINRVLVAAKRFVGVPYVWGGADPDGFDCSGYIQYVFRLSGVNLPRTADIQFEAGRPVSYDQLRPGDVVFFSTYEPGPSHNGIYLGDGRFINASSSQGVAIASLSNSYWSSRYLGARRLVR